jgi:hypothetical protein
MTAHPEGLLQVAVARYLDVRGLPWFHPANERRCTPAQGAWLTRMGVKAGVPDCLIFRPFHKLVPGPAGSGKALDIQAAGLAIELKAPGGRVSPAQKEWIETLTRCGWHVEVCRSIDAVIEIVEWAYGRGR